MAQVSFQGMGSSFLPTSSQPVTHVPRKVLPMYPDRTLHPSSFILHPSRGPAMPFAQIDGIKTHYQVTGNGIPLLMLAPGGFDSTMAKFGSGGNATWKPLNPLQSLADE